MSIARNKLVQVTIEKDHAVVTLSGPKGNALDNRMQKELTNVFIELKENKTISAIVLKAEEGPRFCVGGNVVEMRDALQSGSIQYFIDLSNMYRVINDVNKPILGVIKGHAVGGGSTLASLCQYTIAVPNIKFGYPERQFGFSAPFVAAPYILKRIGFQATLDLFSREELIDTDQAETIHLVDQVCGLEEIDAVAEEKLVALKKQPFCKSEMPAVLPECKSSDSEMVIFFKEVHRLYLDRSEKGKDALSEYTGRRFYEVGSTSSTKKLLEKYIIKNNLDKPKTSPEPAATVELKKEASVKDKKTSFSSMTKIGIFAATAVTAISVITQIVTRNPKFGS